MKGGGNMDNIGNVSNSIQEFCEILGNLLKVDVTVVDSDLKRIAATGEYKNDIGSKLSEGCYYSKLINNDYDDINSISMTYEKCINCNSTETCKELESLAYPIIDRDGKVIGVMGLVAFGTDERNYIKNNYEIVQPFLERICDLLAIQLGYIISKKDVELKKEELSNIINSLETGIFLIDKEFKITEANHYALLLLETDLYNIVGKSIFDIFKSIKIRDIKKNNEIYTSVSVSDEIREILIKVRENREDKINKSFFIEFNICHGCKKEGHIYKNKNELYSNKNLKELNEEFEKDLLQKYLKIYGNTTKGKEMVAEKLDINLSTLYRKIYKYRL